MFVFIVLHLCFSLKHDIHCKLEKYPRRTMQFFPCVMYSKEKHHLEMYHFLSCVTATAEKLHRTICFIIWLGKWERQKRCIREEQITVLHHPREKNVERNSTSHTKQDSSFTGFWFLVKEKKIWWICNTNCRRRTYKNMIQGRKKTGDFLRIRR